MCVCVCPRTCLKQHWCSQLDDQGEYVTPLAVRKYLNWQFLYWTILPTFSDNNLDWTVQVCKISHWRLLLFKCLNKRKWLDHLHNQHLMWEVGFSKRCWYLSGRAGSPTPGLRTGTSRRPVRSPAAQQEVSGGRASEASPAAPHPSRYCLNHPPPSLALTDWTLSHPPPPPTVRGKIVFLETGPWGQKVWGPLW